MRIERCAQDFRARSKVHVFHKTKGYPGEIVRRKLDARNAHVLYIRLVGETTGRLNQTCSAVLRTNSRFLITKHLEVILEYIDNLVRRKRAFDSVRDLVNETFKLLIDVLLLVVQAVRGIEVVRVILAARVDHSVIVGL